MKDTSLRQWQEMYGNGEFSSPDTETQIKAGWYDWFCSSKQLGKKTIALAKPVMKLIESKRINLDTMYVWFKNNCPFDYPLYDDFRIADIETGKVLYTVAHHEPYDKEKHLWNVYAVCEDLVIGKEGYPTIKCYPFKTTKELVAWFNEQKD